MLKILRHRISRWLARIFLEAMQEKHAPEPVFVCMVTSSLLPGLEFELLGLHTGTISGFRPLGNTIGEEIRTKVGEYILIRHGVPLPKRPIPRAILFPTISMLATLGIRRFIKFLRSWPGKSCVNDIDAVKYSVLR